MLMGRASDCWREWMRGSTDVRFFKPSERRPTCQWRDPLRSRPWMTRSRWIFPSRTTILFCARWARTRSTPYWFVCVRRIPWRYGKPVRDRGLLFSGDRRLLKWIWPANWEMGCGPLCVLFATFVRSSRGRALTRGSWNGETGRSGVPIIGWRRMTPLSIAQF